MPVITRSVLHTPASSVYEKMQWLIANDNQLRVPPSHPEEDAE